MIPDQGHYNGYQAIKILDFMGNIWRHHYTNLDLIAFLFTALWLRAMAGSVNCYDTVQAERIFKMMKL